MKRWVKIFLAIVVGLAIMMLGLKALSNEDDWICVEGEWVKHGVPRAPKPSEGCD